MPVVNTSSMLRTSFDDDSDHDSSVVVSVDFAVAVRQLWRLHCERDVLSQQKRILPVLTDAPSRVSAVMRMSAHPIQVTVKGRRKALVYDSRQPSSARLYGAAEVTDVCPVPSPNDTSDTARDGTALNLVGTTRPKAGPSGTSRGQRYHTYTRSAW